MANLGGKVKNLTKVAKAQTLPFEPLISSATTIAATKEARVGELPRVKWIDTSNCSKHPTRVLLLGRHSLLRLRGKADMVKPPSLQLFELLIGQHGLRYRLTGSQFDVPPRLCGIE